MVNTRNMIKVRGHEDLVRTLDDLLDITVPILAGDSGTGKSQSMIYIEESGKYDLVITRRMSGMTDEIVQGIPKLGTNDFKFIKMDFLATIQQNPDKKILLFLDEITRTPDRLRPALFELFERRIEGVFYPNLHIVSAINVGEDFENGWDIAGDKALLSRITLIDYQVSKQEHIDKAKYYFKFNPIITDIMERIDVLADNDTKEEFEQASTLRSWAKLNNACKNITDILEINKKIQKYVYSFFNDSHSRKISIIAQDMIRAKKSLDVMQILAGHPKPAEFSDLELCLYVKEWITKQEDFDYHKYMKQIFTVLKQRKDVLISFISDVLQSEKTDLLAFDGVLTMLNEQEQKLILAMSSRI